MAEKIYIKNLNLGSGHKA